MEIVELEGGHLGSGVGGDPGFPGTRGEAQKQEFSPWTHLGGRAVWEAGGGGWGRGPGEQVPGPWEAPPGTGALLGQLAPLCPRAPVLQKERLAVQVGGGRWGRLPGEEAPSREGTVCRAAGGTVAWTQAPHESFSRRSGVGRGRGFSRGVSLTVGLGLGTAVSGHPFFVGVQYHPEFLSRPIKPSPPYFGLLLASVGRLPHYLQKGCRLSPRWGHAPLVARGGGRSLTPDGQLASRHL